jgi:hypothetical protein
MADYTYKVKVLVNAGGKSHEITSPTFGKEEDARAALEAIRSAQKNTEFVELDWLSVNGSDVVSANLEKSLIPRVRIS